MSKRQVWVFVYNKDINNFAFRAYLRKYQPKFIGVTSVEVEVEAPNGYEAKKLAIAEVKRRLREGEDVDFSLSNLFY